MANMSAEEILEGAKINFETVVKQNPQVGQHPIFQIAMDQLQEGIRKLKEEPE